MAERSGMPASGQGATARRRAEALELRLAGLSYRAVGERLGVSESRAWRIVEAALRAAVSEPAAGVRRLELERLDVLLEEAMRQLRLDHAMVSHGKVVPGVVDEGAKLAALDRCLRIQERRARLLGLDAPAKVHVAEAPAKSDLDERIERLMEEMAALDAHATAPDGGARNS